jgi:hypothetical protein
MRTLYYLAGTALLLAAGEWAVQWVISVIGG